MIGFGSADVSGLLSACDSAVGANKLYDMACSLVVSYSKLSKYNEGSDLPHKLCTPPPADSILRTTYPQKFPWKFQGRRYQEQVAGDNLP